MGADGRSRGEPERAEGGQRRRVSRSAAEQQSWEDQLAAEDKQARAIAERQIWPTADEDDW